MIKSEELRIGNMVYVKPFGIEVPARIQYGHEIDKAYEFEPIPLTEEWLLKFGFEKHETNPFWFKKGKFMVGLGGFAEIMNELGSIVRISSCVYNIHHLQNLYCSVIGEELTFKN